MTVLGVSADAPAQNQRFREKHGFPYRLLSDVDHELAQAYGVWVEKTLYGKKSMGLLRSTFLVDAEGVLRRAWRGVKVAGHVEDVLAAARDLA